MMQRLHSRKALINHMISFGNRRCQQLAKVKIISGGPKNRIGDSGLCQHILGLPFGNVRQVKCRNSVAPGNPQGAYINNLLHPGLLCRSNNMQHALPLYFIRGQLFFTRR